MFLPIVILVGSVYLQTTAFQRGFDFHTQDDNEPFDFSVLDKELFGRAEQNIQIVMPMHSVDALEQLPEIAKSPSGDLLFRIKRLQSFHADLSQSYDEDPGLNGMVMGFGSNKMAMGSSLESDVDQLMAKHGVTVEMVEGKRVHLQSDKPELDGFWGAVNIGKVAKVSNEQLLKRVEYLEDNFHKADIDPCASSPCFDGGACSVQGGSYTCKCGGTYYGTNCEQQDKDECSLNLHDCDLTRSYCVNSVGSFTCHCKRGFTENGVQCTDDDECKSGSDDCNKKTSFCVNTVGSFMCQCKEGFSDNGSGCSDDDECKSGIDDCSKETSFCVNTAGSFTCQCKEGFSDNGFGCTDDDECKSGNDDCNKKTSFCVNTVGSFTCQCKEGFSDNGSGCGDDDECKTGSDDCNKKTSFCVNTVGSFTCQCKEGFSDNGSGCSDDDECKSGSDDCNKETSFCVNTVGSFTCQCKEGFIYSASGCSDDDECKSGSDDCNKKTTVCVNTVGSFTCQCKEGFSDNGSGCSDDDECKSGSDDCNKKTTVCVNTVGSFTCQCKEGFIYSASGCSDDDECKTGNDDCNKKTSFCVNTAGSFMCQCKEGFSDNGFGCLAYPCFKAPYLSGATSGDVIHSADSATVTYTCNSDTIRREGTSEAKCSGITGIWELATMECTPTQCFHSLENYSVYAGTHSTAGGITCQRFDSQSPHKHDGCTVIPYFFHEKTLADASNYCRDPDKTKVPWCYTTDKNVRWLPCDIPPCKPGPSCSIAPFVPGAKVASMRRYQDGRVTARYQCLSGFVPVSSLDAECKGQVHGVEHWDVVMIMCEPTDCMLPISGNAAYQGTWGKTKKGRTCQRWAKQSPHHHKYTVEKFRGVTSLDEVGNYCRDTDGDGTTWCYTTNIFVRWEWCNIPVCNL